MRTLVSSDLSLNTSDRLVSCYMNLTRGPLPSSVIATPLVCFIAGVVGNIMALTVMYTMRRDVKKTPYYFLLVGLAWTDLVGQLATSPIVLAVYANDLNWVGGPPLCTYHAFAMIFFGTITPILVCTLACERFIALICTYSYSSIITVRSVKILFVICCVSVLLFSSLPFMGLGHYDRQYPGTWCFLNYHNESHSDTVYAYLFSFLNILSIALILALNACVCYALLRMRRRRLNSTSANLRTKDHETRNPSCMEVESQMVVFLCTISILFVTCWLPLNVNIMINLSRDLACHKWDLLTVRLASFNQVLDPWIYIILRKSVLHKLYRLAKTRFFSRHSSKENVITTRGAETRLLRANLQPGPNSLEIICRDDGYVKVESKDSSIIGTEEGGGRGYSRNSVSASGSHRSELRLWVTDESTERFADVETYNEGADGTRVSSLDQIKLSDIVDLDYVEPLRYDLTQDRNLNDKSKPIDKHSHLSKTEQNTIMNGQNNYCSNNLDQIDDFCNNMIHGSVDEGARSLCDTHDKKPSSSSQPHI